MKLSGTLIKLANQIAAACRFVIFVRVLSQLHTSKWSWCQPSLQARREFERNALQQSAPQIPWRRPETAALPRRRHPTWNHRHDTKSPFRLGAVETGALLATKRHLLSEPLPAAAGQQDPCCKSEDSRLLVLRLFFLAASVYKEYLEYNVLLYTVHNAAFLQPTQIESFASSKSIMKQHRD